MSKDTDRPYYLGDGLYATYDGEMYTLFAHNGLDTTDKVFLDNSVLAAFFEYVSKTAKVRITVEKQEGVL